jgi:hypothetical protein
MMNERGKGRRISHKPPHGHFCRAPPAPAILLFIIHHFAFIVILSFWRLTSIPAFRFWEETIPQADKDRPQRLSGRPGNLHPFSILSSIHLRHAG